MVRLAEFDDLRLLDNDMIARIVADTDETELAAALRGGSPIIRDRVMDILPSDVVRRIRHKVDGPVRPSRATVEEAQQRLLDKARLLHQETPGNSGRADRRG